MDALKVLVPAAVYTIQNFLLYVAIENLPATTHMVCGLCDKLPLVDLPTKNPDNCALHASASW